MVMKALVLVIPLLLVTSIAFSNINLHGVYAQQNQTSAEGTQSKGKLNTDQLLNFTNQAIIDVKDLKGKSAKKVQDNLEKIQEALIKSSDKAVVVIPPAAVTSSSSGSSSSK